MQRQSHWLAVLLLLALTVPGTAQATTGSQSPGHTKMTGVVTDAKSGILTVKTDTGTTLRINRNAEMRHGHAMPQVGDELTIWVNENNTVIDVHPKGQEGIHRFITGKLAYVGKMKDEIKLWTPEGEKVFPLERLEVKTGGIEEGALVTVELNEAGTVIDLHRADTDQIVEQPRS